MELPKKERLRQVFQAASMGLYEFFQHIDYKQAVPLGLFRHPFFQMHHFLFLIKKCEAGGRIHKLGDSFPHGL